MKFMLVFMHASFESCSLLFTINILTLIVKVERGVSAATDFADMLQIMGVINYFAQYICRSKTLQYSYLFAKSTLKFFKI